MAKTKACDADEDHPSSDKTNRHSMDFLIRSHGWRIASRPKDGEATWAKGGTVLAESQVLKQIWDGADAKGN